ncbi:carboxypeptidase regulatory-like domain-containing protein [Candidatus Aerophobetes bacterium]|nr:carboxypeptidase regulatory-like domain-containing protein [Candidatus Aerophobetes bacterium]
MRVRILLLLLLFAVFLVGCGQRKRIEGTVQDVFGNPLKGVTVKIEKSRFSSITDSAGKYSLDYAPGPLEIKFSKDGYTTIRLTLNIQQKSHYPAPNVVLYPIPKGSGMFYIDTSKKQLVKLEPNCKVRETKKHYENPWTPDRYYYYVKCPDKVLVIRPGKAQFIDMIPHQINISKVRKDGLIYEREFALPFTVYYGSLGGGSELEVGDEGLLVRTVNLQPGLYAWVETETYFFTDEIFPKNGSSAICFKVEGTTR